MANREELAELPQILMYFKTFFNSIYMYYMKIYNCFSKLAFNLVQLRLHSIIESVKFQCTCELTLFANWC